MKPSADKFKKFLRQMSLPQILFLFVAVWTAVILAGGLPYGDLSGYDDAAYAHEGRAIIQSGDWWTLTLGGKPDFDKPPLFIWLLALSFKIFGATDFAAKIPSALLGWATVILVYFLARELFSSDSEIDDENEVNREWLAPLSMLCMATTQYFLKYSTHAMTDVPFTFFFTLAVYFYVLVSKNKLFLLASGAAIGFATLTRSPMGLFPLGIIVLHLLVTRQRKTLFSAYFAGCLFFAAAIPAAWYLREYALYGDFFIKRHFSNILGHSAAASEQTRTGWQQFLWYFEYLFLIVKLYFPWFPLMFYGFYSAVKKARKNFAPVETLLIIWICAVLLPFSLAESKVLRYILPIFPAFAILSAYALAKIFSTKILKRFAQTAILLLTLAAIVSLAFPNYLMRGEDMHAIAPFSDAATAPQEKVYLYTFGDLQWNYQNQMLWYGNRPCILLKNFEEIEALASEEKRIVVIMDKTSFANFTKQTKLKIENLGESEHFVCFRLIS